MKNPLTVPQTEQLIRDALNAREASYAPYSDYAVGAALLCGDGKVYQGCNIENASFGATNCAERTAFFKAVSGGARSFQAIAVTGGSKGQEPDGYAYPCGVCRQVMQEFCDAEFVIIVAKSVSEYEVLSLGELFPHSFGGEVLK